MNKECCETKNNKNGIFSGILFGLIPHSFCIAFVLFSIIGAVTASAFLKKLMLIPNLFLLLIIISLALATVSTIFYLRRNNCLCLSGIKNKWKYVSTLYFATISINLLMFFVVFPALANTNFQKTESKVFGQESNLSQISLTVEIPCSGHSSLIIDEIKKNCDIESVTFSMPNKFDIKYNPKEITAGQITSLEIFKIYPAKIN